MNIGKLSKQDVNMETFHQTHLTVEMRPSDSERGGWARYHRYTKTVWAEMDDSYKHLNRLQHRICVLPFKYVYDSIKMFPNDHNIIETFLETMSFQSTLSRSPPYLMSIGRLKITSNQNHRFIFPRWSPLHSNGEIILLIGEAYHFPWNNTTRDSSTEKIKWKYDTVPKSVVSSWLFR